MDAVAGRRVATVTGEYDGVGPLGGGFAAVVARLHAPDHAAFFAAHVADEGEPFEPKQAGFHYGGSAPALGEHIICGELFQRGQHGGTAQRVGAPRVGSLTVVE